jgi:hypothetical protein
VENTIWQGRGEVCFHVQSSEVIAPACVSVKDRSSGPDEQVQLCSGLYEIYGVPQT